MATKTSARTALKARRQRRVRKKVVGSSDRPRLAVYRSNRHISAQLIDDSKGETLAAASTYEGGVRSEGSTGTVTAASEVGRLIAERGKAAGVESVVFDRGGNKYHGRVAALADAAREAGLEF
ncbi:MAG: 50S ribosomal protein L18 [Acidimicrobiia bacterium]|nr:50S ribosomal protein L18 [Acidimicrobiia bacterium]